MVTGWLQRTRILIKSARQTVFTRSSGAPTRFHVLMNETNTALSSRYMEQTEWLMCLFGVSQSLMAELPHIRPPLPFCCQHGSSSTQNSALFSAATRMWWGEVSSSLGLNDPPHMLMQWCVDFIDLELPLSVRDYHHRGYKWAATDMDSIEKGNKTFPSSSTPLSSQLVVLKHLGCSRICFEVSQLQRTMSSETFL